MLSVTFPEDYQTGDTAGKEAKFVLSQLSKRSSNLDDELAKTLTVETLAELKKYRNRWLLLKLTGLDEGATTGKLWKRWVS